MRVSGFGRPERDVSIENSHRNTPKLPKYLSLHGVSTPALRAVPLGMERSRANAAYIAASFVKAARSRSPSDPRMDSATPLTVAVASLTSAWPLGVRTA